MSLPQEYLDELNNLNKLVARDQPKDVIEYCSTYFNNKLNSRRSTQQFRNSSFSMTSGAPIFKSPFVSNDPHSTLSEDPHSNPNFISDTSGDVNAPFFKSGLRNGKRSIHDDEDPHAVSGVIDNFDPNAQLGAGEPGHGHSQNFSLSGSSAFNNQHSNNSSNHHNNHGTNDNSNATFNVFRRSSVSAETLNPINFQNDDWKPPFHELSQEQLERLNKAIVKNFLFSSLDDDALNTVLHALQEKKFPKDSLVIKQGDEGDFFYLVEKGEVEFIVNGESVSSASIGASFGELALMYNSPRAATVKAKTDLILWALDRLTFRRILLEVTAKKRLMYEEFLRSVKILADLSPYQRSKLADALHGESYEPGTTIIKEGDVGENFYFIESGEAEIYKESDGFIGTLTKGDYFGEIALLNDLPRQASIKAKTAVKVATLGKSAFQRLLGPVVEVLKAQDPRKN